jgi:hypothetical protein
MDYFFASESLGPLPMLLGEITEVTGEAGRMEIYRDVHALTARLRRRNRPGIMILLAATRRDLAGLTALRDAILDADVVLLVLDGEPDTVAAAHTLRPSYLGQLDGDLDRVVPVLRRLIDKRAKTARGGEPA